MQDILTYKNQRFHSLWLRDNCQCPECRHENGQRLHETWQLPADVKIAESRETDTGLWVRFAEPHAHESEFIDAYLTEHAYDQPAAKPETTSLWEAIWSWTASVSNTRTSSAMTAPSWPGWMRLSATASPSSAGYPHRQE
ncbi:gamma-butyrobetaine hydroxylase-like domain-containing protein [Aliamphritea spongicola]|nr:gamma-butyrobetaine hydroxylase-like domain-containing protein [Aliamphritea spongicola]